MGISMPWFCRGLIVNANGGYSMEGSASGGHQVSEREEFPDAEGKYAGERHLSRFRLVVRRTINRATGTPPRRVDDPAGLIQSYDVWRPR
jgi:hypothetical protein